MAANFWLSSHCNQWLLDREEIELERQRDYQYLKGDEYKKIHIFFCQFHPGVRRTFKAPTAQAAQT